MIEAVVLYSSNDSRFFEVCINNLLESGIKVHVVTYSHMWSGDLEDQIILKNKSTIKWLFLFPLLYLEFELQLVMQSKQI